MLPISIDASKCFGSDNKSITILSLFFLLFCRVKRSSPFREKKATSEPEIKPDKIIKLIKTKR